MPSIDEYVEQKEHSCTIKRNIPYSFTMENNLALSIKV